MLRTPNAALWALLRPLLRLILRLKLHFRAPRVRMEGAFVLLCNHASWYDPLLAAVSVGKPLCFAGADAPPRAGLLLRLARALRLPDELPWQEALRQAGERGCCVGLFPEGRRCADGVTGPLPAGLARAVKDSGLSLVVLRLQGAYLTAPRWADSIPRPGRLRARVLRTLTPGVLRAMDDGELQALLTQDLHEDAFVSVRKHPAPYRGERTAERLERLLCVCPKCGELGAMESHDNEFSCRACGFTTVYTLSGGFRGGKVPFSDPGHWSRWQNERIRLRCSQAGDSVIFEDGGYELYEVRSGGRIGSGGLHLYRDRLELPTGVSLPLGEILSLDIVGGSDLRIESRRGSLFELKTIRPLCAEKYRVALAMLKESAEKAPEAKAPVEEPEETAPEEEKISANGDEEEEASVTP